MAATPMSAPAAIAAGVMRLPDAYSNDAGPGVTSFFDENCQPLRVCVPLCVAPVHTDFLLTQCVHKHPVSCQLDVVGNVQKSALL